MKTALVSNLIAMAVLFGSMAYGQKTTQFTVKRTIKASADKRLESGG